MFRQRVAGQAEELDRREAEAKAKAEAQAIRNS